MLQANKTRLINIINVIRVQSIFIHMLAFITMLFFYVALKVVGCPKLEHKKELILLEHELCVFIVTFLKYHAKDELCDTHFNECKTKTKNLPQKSQNFNLFCFFSTRKIITKKIQETFDKFCILFFLISYSFASFFLFSDDMRKALKIKNSVFIQWQKMNQKIYK